MNFSLKLANHKNIEIHSSHKENNWYITLADTGDKSLKGFRVKKSKNM